jgi:hypothetical protein
MFLRHPVLLRVLLAVPAAFLAVALVLAQPPNAPPDRPDESLPPALRLNSLPMDPVPYTTNNDGFTFEFGAFDLSAKPEGMMIIRSTFPVKQRFVRFPLTYLGPYEDGPYKGDLFRGTADGKRRYFLFCAVSPNDWTLVYYNESGKLLQVYHGHRQRARKDSLLRN